MKATAALYLASLAKELTELPGQAKRNGVKAGWKIGNGVFQPAQYANQKDASKITINLVPVINI